MRRGRLRAASFCSDERLWRRIERSFLRLLIQGSLRFASTPTGRCARWDPVRFGRDDTWRVDGFGGDDAGLNGCGGEDAVPVR